MDRAHAGPSRKPLGKGCGPHRARPSSVIHSTLSLRLGGGCRAPGEVGPGLQRPQKVGGLPHTGDNTANRYRNVILLKKHQSAFEVRKDVLTGGMVRGLG